MDVQNDCDGLQQKFQHAGYFTSNPLITQPIFTRFLLLEIYVKLIPKTNNLHITVGPVRLMPHLAVGGHIC